MSRSIPPITRRNFLAATGGAVAGFPRVLSAQPEQENLSKEPRHRAIRLFNCDFNWARFSPTEKFPSGLFAESSDEVVGWLLKIRQPHQRVMTTIVGRANLSDPNTTWENWYDRGCDFFGYAFATPPGFEPTKYYRNDLEFTRKAFQKMQSREA